jgi:fructokinase
VASSGDKDEAGTIGVDLGGTKIEAIAASRAAGGLDVRIRRRIATERDRGYDAVLTSVVDLIRSVAASAGLDVATVPIGVGMPGGVTRREGLVKNSNTVCLNGRPFRSDLASALGRPILFDNDANCFALAESCLGAATAHASGVVFGVILGTGVGGGVVIRGSIWEGAQGIAGEWGHHAVFAAGRGSGPAPGLPPGDRGPCYCGQRGCLEQYASGPAVEDDYARRSGSRIDLASIAARRGEDPHARAAIEGLIDAFGRGLANVIDILDPSAVVLGGGVSNLDLLYDEGRARVAHYVFNDELTTPILRNTLGDSAGVFGAALLAAPVIPLGAR